MINTVIINPQKQDREKIAALLIKGGDIKVLAQGKDGYDALKLISTYKPDIAILDNQLEFIEGGEIPPLLKLRSPETAIVILVAKISDYQLYRAASHKVLGFVSKETDMDTLPVVLKCIFEGGCFISPHLAARVLKIFSALNGDRQVKKTEKRDEKFRSREDPTGYLSKMELQMLAYIGEGKSSDEIAGNLHLAVGTVRNYISTVMRKTGTRNRS
ncbi:MAG: response regulator transcription factor, partial [Treponema sp.]|nr:response regulator transcription factor [Treponema sp.]